MGKNYQTVQSLMSKFLNRMQVLTDTPIPIEKDLSTKPNLKKFRFKVKSGDMKVISSGDYSNISSILLGATLHVAYQTNLPILMFASTPSFDGWITELVSHMSKIDIERLITFNLRDHEWAMLTESIESLRHREIFFFGGMRSLASICEEINLQGNLHQKLGAVVIDAECLHDLFQPPLHAISSAAYAKKNLKSLAEEMRMQIILVIPDAPNQFAHDSQ